MNRSTSSYGCRGSRRTGRPSEPADESRLRVAWRNRGLARDLRPCARWRAPVLLRDAESRTTRTSDVCRVLPRARHSAIPGSRLCGVLPHNDRRPIPASLNVPPSPDRSTGISRQGHHPARLGECLVRGTTWDEARHGNSIRFSVRPRGRDAQPKERRRLSSGSGVSDVQKRASPWLTHRRTHRSGDI